MSRALRAVPAQTSDRESTTCPSLLPAEIPAGCDAAIRYIARRCGDRALAEDLTQDAMVVILSHAELRSAWRDADLIFRVSLNALNNHRRKERGRLRLLEERGDDMVATINEHEEYDVALDIGGALSRLTAADRELLLDSWYGFRLAELQKKYDCSSSAIKMRIHRARRALANELSGYLPDPGAHTRSQTPRDT